MYLFYMCVLLSVKLLNNHQSCYIRMLEWIYLENHQQHCSLFYECKTLRVIHRQP